MAKDFGDRRPSDADDVASSSPTQAFNELDYRVLGAPSKFKAEEERDFIPDLDVENVPGPKRVVYSGQIIAWLTAKGTYPRQYYVLRQDGRYGIAKAIETLLYADIIVGDSVAVIEDQVDDQWTIVANHRPEELPWIDLYATGYREGNTPFVVPLDATLEKLPVNNSFGLSYDKVRFLNNGVVRVASEGEAVYEIKYSVTLECTNAEPRTDFIRIEEKCRSFAVLNAQRRLKGVVDRVGKIQFNEQNGFYITSNDKGIGTVSLKSPLEDSIFCQFKTGKMPIWTTSPRILATLSIATSGLGWLKIGNDDTYAWITRGDSGKLRLKLPAGPPGSAKYYPIVDAVSGECVKLGWQQPGADGIFPILKITSWCYATTGLGGYCAVPVLSPSNYAVANGLLMSGEGLELDIPTPPAECFDVLSPDHDPCMESPRA